MPSMKYSLLLHVAVPIFSHLKVPLWIPRVPSKSVCNLLPYPVPCLISSLKGFQVSDALMEGQILSTVSMMVQKRPRILPELWVTLANPHYPWTPNTLKDFQLTELQTGELYRGCNLETQFLSVESPWQWRPIWVSPSGTLVKEMQFNCQRN